MLVLAVWMLTRVHRQLRSRGGRWLLALAAAVGFLLSLVGQGIYGQRAFRRDLHGSTVAFPAGLAGGEGRSPGT
jgi:hypothetical protein